MEALRGSVGGSTGGSAGGLAGVLAGGSTALSEGGCEGGPLEAWEGVVVISSTKVACIRFCSASATNTILKTLLHSIFQKISPTTHQTIHRFPYIDATTCMHAMHAASVKAHTTGSAVSVGVGGLGVGSAGGVSR